MTGELQGSRATTVPTCATSATRTEPHYHLPEYPQHGLPDRNESPTKLPNMAPWDANDPAAATSAEI
jgi:hypothetical protein